MDEGGCGGRMWGARKRGRGQQADQEVMGAASVGDGCGYCREITLKY